MEVTGKLIEIMDTYVVSDKFKKREFVLEVALNPAYPEQILFQATQAKCDYLDNYRPGDMLDVQYNLKGRKTDQGRYFNTLEAWKFDKANG